MKIGPLHRICQVSKNILLPTDLLGPQYFAEAKVLLYNTIQATSQHVKNSAKHEKKVEHAVWEILKHPGLSIPNAKELCTCNKICMAGLK